jgi:hypothetical protein
MQFFDDTSAGAATIDIGRLILGPTNESNDVQFYGRSTAANSTITARGDGGRVSFAGNFDPRIRQQRATTIVALGFTVVNACARRCDSFLEHRGQRYHYRSSLNGYRVPRRLDHIPQRRSRRQRHYHR